MMDDRKSGLAKAVLVAACVAGASYLLPVWWINQQAPTGMDGAADAVRITWKGAGVALLALYAALNAKSAYGWLLTTVMAFGALGDVLIDAIGLEAGALAFGAGHLLAILLYWNHRRANPSGSQRLLGLILPPVALYATWMMTADFAAMLYATFLGVMASLAWTSAFPRFRTGLGALLFVISDLLIFAREGGTIGGLASALSVWLLYFCGQVLIVLGVTQTLERQ